MTTVNSFALSNWTPASRCEPRVRVGVVLPSDQMGCTHLVVPDSAYGLQLDGRMGDTIPPGPVEVVAAGARLRVRHGSTTSTAASVVRMSPAHERPLERGGGIQVREVVAGRGFHWQKRADFTYGGALEFRVHDGHLLVVNELPLETYLAGVVTAEMSGACPLEFMKSQILVARAWVLAHTEEKHPGLPIDRCNDDCCQRYQGTTFLTPTAITAIERTRGQVAFHAGGRIIDANYSKSCGGIIEAPEFLWGVSKAGQRAAVDAPRGSAAARFLPVTEDKINEYLNGRWLGTSDCFCSPNIVPEDELPRYLGGVDEGGEYFRWHMSYGREELEHVLSEKYFSQRARAGTAALGTLLDLQPVKRGDSGRIIELGVHYLDPAGHPHVELVVDQYVIRDALHKKFLFSSAFDVRAERGADGEPARFMFRGAGWGHGAGLCQIGALGMALSRYSAEEIVGHYFADVQTRTCY